MYKSIEVKAAGFNSFMDRERKCLTRIKDQCMILSENADFLSKDWEGDAKSEWLMEESRLLEEISQVNDKAFKLLCAVENLAIKLKETQRAVEAISSQEIGD